ncbi:MAG: hypothetical protein JSR58_03300 [Verrucomicrobia bacterium]|nr:hypothetical protein [Verrucomicrobiota bacterium]
MHRVFFWIFLPLYLWSSTAQFDYIFIGSSPIPLIEALYRSYNGKRVLVLESDTTIGGSWKAIDICGVSGVDMGCHQIGQDPKLKSFLEDRIGCHLVPMTTPQNQMLQSSDSGLYFAGGCYELMSALYALIEKSTVVLLVNTKAESVYLDFDREIAEVKTKDMSFSTSKVVITPHSSILVENYPHLSRHSTSKHYHLYLLIEDPTPPHFSYQNGICPGMSRIINVTPFSSSLQGSGYQLVAIQTFDEMSLNKGDVYFEELKKKKWIDPTARLICAEKYIYEQAHFNLGKINLENPKAGEFFEVLSTDAIWNIPHHTERWEKVFNIVKNPG